LHQAIDRFRDAEAKGADVAMLIAILEQVVAALSAAWIRTDSSGIEREGLDS